ncbi:MAG: hypothetical protein ACHQVK_01525 [Candidatus Paceibacterales bacterium]
MTQLLSLQDRAIEEIRGRNDVEQNVGRRYILRIRMTGDPELIHALLGVLERKSVRSSRRALYPQLR